MMRGQAALHERMRFRVDLARSIARPPHRAPPSLVLDRRWNRRWFVRRSLTRLERAAARVDLGLGVPAIGAGLLAVGCDARALPPGAGTSLAFFGACWLCPAGVLLLFAYFGMQQRQHVRWLLQALAVLYLIGFVPLADALR